MRPSNVGFLVGFCVGFSQLPDKASISGINRLGLDCRECQVFSAEETCKEIIAGIRS
jgi:hypothetical protein